MRTLGIDFGERRVGLALSDPDGRVAVPLETLTRVSDLQVIDHILEIVRREGIERLVLGEPINLDGTRGPAAERVQSFSRKLTDKSGLTCELVDESLTSVEATERLRRIGVDPRRHPERVDAMAAQILLQQLLDRERRRGEQ